MRALPVLLLTASFAAPGCMLDLGGDDEPPGDDGSPPPVDPPPDPIPTATRVIGTNPHITAQSTDWAEVWINYPSIDCQRVETYGADLPVRIDVRYDEFVARTGLVPGSSQPFVVGWLALSRESPDHLWRVTNWVPDGEPQPECYVW